MPDQNELQTMLPAQHDERDHEAVIAALKAMLKREQERAADTERLDWLERWHTLHRTVEFLYVVDGYEVTLTRDYEVEHGPYHGETIRKAIDKARALHDSP